MAVPLGFAPLPSLGEDLGPTQKDPGRRNLATGARMCPYFLELGFLNQARNPNQDYRADECNNDCSNYPAARPNPD